MLTLNNQNVTHFDLKLKIFTNYETLNLDQIVFFVI